MSELAGWRMATMMKIETFGDRAYEEFVCEAVSHSRLLRGQMKDTVASPSRISEPWPAFVIASAVDFLPESLNRISRFWPALAHV